MVGEFLEAVYWREEEEVTTTMKGHGRRPSLPAPVSQYTSRTERYAFKGLYRARPIESGLDPRSGAAGLIGPQGLY